MSGPFLSIGRLERRLSTGNTEGLKWLRTLDYLLGDPDSVESAFEDHIVEKYDAAAVELFIGDERLLVERRWKEAGSKTKVFVDGAEMTVRGVQHLLLEKLGIPLLHFPRGNPMSGQTWPELSWRMLLRHIYRQQRFWGGLADQQPEGEQHACLLQFLGLAEHIFTDTYGLLIQHRLDVERLKARREQYSLTLNALGPEVLSDPDLQVAVTFGSVQQAETRLNAELEEIRQRRNAVIAEGRDRALPAASMGRIGDLGRERASLIIAREETSRRETATAERLEDMARYRRELADEIERLARAAAAGAVLADLKITHCPACDQPLAPSPEADAHCHLCHRPLPDEPLLEGLGATRLKFETDRLQGEMKEADSLLDVLQRETRRLRAERIAADERLRMVENELIPARDAVSALVREEVSAIDMAMGELNERQRQVSRLKGALELGHQMTAQIEALESEIEPLQRAVDEAVRAADFGHAEEQLGEGINTYLNAIRRLNPQAWRHSQVDVNLSRSGFSIKVGTRRWSAALGGTDTLYFLMAYHFGLLALSEKGQCHYPGLSIIDLPGDFLGESVEDKENFIVQPFIDLLATRPFQGAQVIIAGASFLGLEGPHRVPLHEIFVG
jgi:hypothetical protein